MIYALQKSIIFRVVIFLVINFGALTIGGLFTSEGVSSDWYQNLNKAPWTPPGWVFGAAWTTIMILFSLYMAVLWEQAKSKIILTSLYLVQLILNIGWNPTFFYYHNSLMGLVVISGLTVLIAFKVYYYFSCLKIKSLLLAPYLLWLLIATSLNAYIIFFN